MHTVAILALDGVMGFDLTTPIQVFGRTLLPDGRAAYRVRVCAVEAGTDVDAGEFTMRAPWGLAELAEADTIICPGRADPSMPTPTAAIAALRVAAARGTRIASICVGAFVLAEAGLLDGLRATTHWLGTATLAERYPEVAVDPDVLYIDNGSILTSAGAAAGLDLCLYMIRLDHGSAVAANSARDAVMPLERAGGQAQFIVHEPPAPDGASLEPLLAWLRAHSDRELLLDDIAAHAGMSARSLNRHFREQTGTTPLQWLHRVRISRAQHLLETTAHSVDRIAAQTGFGSPTAFRDRFKRVTGTTPQSYRRAFRSRDD
ncbi:GlxA family transcriptional regulator [Embleya sp. NPDC059259]|uniref:GlxA family transcriptional regulator n=1 Tax=unclassified Embleya TaxID=2699296 RepID=UPI0036B75EFF